MIQIADKVVFLYMQYLEKGDVVKVNAKSITIAASFGNIRVNPEKVLPVSSKFVPICIHRTTPTEGYRLDTTTYPQFNNSVDYWLNSTNPNYMNEYPDGTYHLS